MPTLLRVDASPLGPSQSFSRQLTGEFVDRWRHAHPDGKVITRDLAATSLPPVNAEWIDATSTPSASATPRQREALAVSDQLTAELLAADEYVFGVPMYNFFIPGVLKLWIDQVVRAGRTFTYEANGPKGLLVGKKATVLISSGGVYEPGSPAAAMNFVEPYLRTIFGRMGLTDIHVIYAGGTGRARHGVDRATILQPALASLDAQFHAA